MYRTAIQASQDQNSPVVEFFNHEHENITGGYVDPQSFEIILVDLWGEEIRTGKTINPLNRNKVIDFYDND